MARLGLEGKTVLVTGANNPHGIGAAIARAFAAQGANLFLHYYSVPGGGQQLNRGNDQAPGESFYLQQSQGNADEVLADLRSQGVEAEAFEGNLSDSGLASEIFNQACDRFGSVDILVNNAADWVADSFIPNDKDLVNPIVEMWTDRPEQISAKSFNTNFDVNVRAVALLMAEYANQYLGAGLSWGRIINISSGGAHCFPSEVSYGASKLALEGITRSAAKELGQFGITVNAISPGAIQTGWITPEMEELITKQIPLGRVGLPEDVADAVVLICSEQARWITGQLIQVGGGQTV